MATTVAEQQQQNQQTTTNQLPKLGILEEDDEFEEFPIEGT